MKTCENCGERVYGLGCTNCNEAAYVEEQEMLTDLIYGSSASPQHVPVSEGEQMTDGHDLKDCPTCRTSLTKGEALERENAELRERLVEEAADPTCGNCDGLLDKLHAAEREIARLQAREREVFSAGFQQGLEATDKFGEQLDTVDEAYERFLATPPVHQQGQE